MSGDGDGDLVMVMAKHTTSVAAFWLAAINQFLLGKTHQLIVLDRVSTFDGTSGAERLKMVMVMW